MARVPWTLKDGVTNIEYEFEINPLTAEMPSVEKATSTEYTTAGAPINFEGRDLVQRIRFSGTILTEEQFAAMTSWMQESTQILLTDDLGSEFWVYLTSFTPTRRYTPQYPWRHDYSAEAIVISWD